LFFVLRAAQNDAQSGSGSAGGGGAGGPSAGTALTVVEVRIDVDDPASASDVVVRDLPSEDAVPRTEPTTDGAGDADTSGVHGLGGQGAGAGGSSSGGAGGFGDGSLEGAGARTGAAAPGSGRAETVPPRPVEITWPDTRRLKHCVGMRVAVRVLVDERGRVTRAERASTGLPEDCARAALATAERIRFTPGTIGGKPAPLWAHVTIEFEENK
jgi:TonB family protein